MTVRNDMVLIPAVSVFLPEVTSWQLAVPRPVTLLPLLFDLWYYPNSFQVSSLEMLRVFRLVRWTINCHATT